MITSPPFYQSFFQQQWQVLKSLASLVPMIKYIWALALLLSLLGLAAYWVSVEYWMFLLFPGGVFAVVAVMFFGTILPGQMPSMVSSKHFGLLPGLRLHLAIILFSYCVGISLAIAVALRLAFFPCFLLVSLLMVGTAFLTTILPFFWGGIFFALPFVGYLYIPLIHLTWNAYAVLLMTCWSVFLCWWFAWKPKRFYRSYFGASMTELIDVKESHWGKAVELIRWNNGTPRSLPGALLAGQPDTWQKFAFRALVSSLGLLVMFLVFKYALGSLDEGFYRIFLPMMLVLLVVGTTVQQFEGALCNLYRVWLVVPQTRQQLWRCLEHKSLKLMLAQLALQFPIFMLLGYGVFRFPLNLALYAYLSALTLLLLAAGFYITVIAYVKIGNGFNKIAWTNLLMMFSSLPFTLVSTIWWELMRDNRLLWGGSSLAILLLLVIFFRQRALSLWPRASFVQVGR